MRSNTEEARLARAAASGDGHAFAQLYDRYEKPVYNYCLRLLGNEHDAQDATQDAFLKTMRRLPEMGDRELDFGPYLYTVARNASYDMIGRRKRTRPVDEISDQTGPIFGDGLAIDEDPVRSAMLAADLDSIRAANARLPERQREVLALREIQGMSYEDIADLLEMNSNSVAQLISRARLRLRNELRNQAAAAVSTTGPDCERALPLLASRQDGKLTDGADDQWLSDHLVGCPTCPLAAEAMAEAGLSYRAWAPALPAAWLFRDTLAKAADLVGADWADVERPDPAAHPDRSEGGADDQDASGPEGLPSSRRATAADVAADAEKKRRRRGILVGSLGSLLLLLVFGGLATGVLGGEADEPAVEATPAPAASADRSKQPTTASAADDPSTSPPNPASKKSTGKKKKKPEQQPTTDKQPAASPVQTSSTAPAAPSHTETVTEARPEPETRRPRDRGRAGVAGDGTGSWGVRVRPDKPTQPPRTTEPPAATDPPPASVPPPTDPPPNQPPSRDPNPPPPGGPNDPPVDGGQQPPATPCLVRVC